MQIKFTYRLRYVSKYICMYICISRFSAKAKSSKSHSISTRANSQDVNWQETARDQRCYLVSEDFESLLLRSKKVRISMLSAQLQLTIVYNTTTKNMHVAYFLCSNKLRK